MTEHRNCLPPDLILLNVALAFINGLLALIAFAQLIRIHMRSQQDGWTRQKVLHLMIGFSNLGYLVYFISTIVATCNGWHRWSHACGFILMAFPKILFLAVFLLILSFWVDLCHQSNEDEEDNDENSMQQALLEIMKKEPGSPHVKDHWRCCSFQGIHAGTRQKYVIVIVIMIFLVMMSFAVMIRIGDTENLINPSVVAQVYEKLLAVISLLLAAALGCYSFLLFFRLRSVRSEKASSEMWKIVSLAIVSAICLSTTTLVAFLTDIPLFYHWHLRIIFGVRALVFVILYYFVGSCLPSAYLLWIIRELPPPITVHIPEQPTAYTFISEGHSDMNQPRYWATATCWTNHVSHQKLLECRDQEQVLYKRSL